MRLIIIVLFILQYAYCQSDFKLIYEKDLDWSEFDIEISMDEKLEFLKQIKKFDNKNYFRNHYGYTDDENSFSFVDLNNDNKIDIIYYGYLSSELMVSIIFMNSDKGYYYLGEIIGTIKKIEKTNFIFDVKTYISICCAGHQYSINNHTIDFTKKSGELYHKQRMIFTDYIDKPKTLLKKEIPFVVMNETYSLRFNPFINDSDIEVQVTAEAYLKGNKLASYPKGSKGIAIADSVDNTGRVWWFVVMDPADIDDKNFFPDNINIPTYYTGWMSNRYLKQD